MARKPRLHYTAELRSRIWDKYKQGDSLWSIARSLDRSSSCIYGLLAPTGGIRPPDRKRAKLALSLAEREEISRGIVANLSIRAIAAQLGRSPSTVSRELIVMAAMPTIEPRKLTKEPGTMPFAQNDVNWPSTTL